MSALKELRLRKGATQEEIAIEMQVSVATVSRWENEKFLPKTDKLPALAKFLGCTIDELLSDVEGRE